VALNAYLTQTARLLQNPAAPSSLYSTTDLTSYINTARSQLAAESQCIRVLATVNTAISINNYAFTGVTVTGTAGVQQILHVRRMMVSVGAGFRWVPPRPWEWFDLYNLNRVVPSSGAPAVWSQYAQGALGSFFVDPPPNAIYALSLDTVCLPIPLALDTDPEAIPYPFTDAVPFFAAYYALLSSQMSTRQAEAGRMFSAYQEFVKRGRSFSNPSVNNYMYQQSADVVQLKKLGLQGGGGQG